MFCNRLCYAARIRVEIIKSLVRINTSLFHLVSNCCNKYLHIPNYCNLFVIANTFIIYFYTVRIKIH